MRLSKHNRGIITVFIALMLSAVLSFGTLTIEAGRLQAAKTQLAEASSSVATSMIAAYDSDLYEKYGLLAIDTERFTEERCMDYLQFNADQGLGYEGNKVTQMYKIESTELKGMYNLTDPTILKRQILSRAKYHIVPTNYAINTYTATSFFGELKGKCEYVSNSLTAAANGTAATGSLSDVNGTMKEALANLYLVFKDEKKFDENCDVTLADASYWMLPSNTGTVDSNISDADRQKINDANTDVVNVLGTSLSSVGTVTTETDVTVDVSGITDISNILGDLTVSGLSEKTKQVAQHIKQTAQAINAALNTLDSDSETNLLLNSYIAEYFSNRNDTKKNYSAPAKGTTIVGTMANANFASACVEYIISGSQSEKNNQETSFDYIYAFDLINNLYAILTDSTSYNSNNLHSVAAHIAWANYETFADIVLLTKYNSSIPFFKEEMVFPIGNMGLVKSATATYHFENAMKALGHYNGTNFSISGSTNLTYKDYLSLALWVVPNSKKMMRIADLVQLEMRYKQDNVDNVAVDFLASEMNTYCSVNVTAKVITLLPIISLNSSALNGIKIQSIKYAGY